MFVINKARYLLSVLLTELPDYLYKLKQPTNDWLYITNRKQKHIPAPLGSGVCFLSDYTSQLRAPNLVPALSNRLFKKAIENFEFGLSSNRLRCEKPKVSFIIGHKGEDKIAHLLLVIQSIAAQSFDLIECIVVEQSKYVQAREQLPEWVDYYHLETQESDLYNRSLSFNYGAQRAKGEYLILHDNDLLIPVCYTRSHVKLFEAGFDVANLKRFIFGLSEKDTENTFSTNEINAHCTPDYVLQNAKGGGSLAIAKSAYEAIGGFDERFCGWGGEDNEFWQRAQVLKIYPFADLPLIHLWHAPQQDKRKGQRGGGQYTEALLDELSQIPIYNRIKSLTTAKP